MDQRREGEAELRWALPAASAGRSRLLRSPCRAGHGEQAALAQRYGIHGFCYYYYWFNGKRLLELPLERMLMTGKPDFPFCLLLGERKLDAALGWP